MAVIRMVVAWFGGFRLRVVVRLSGFGWFMFFFIIFKLGDFEYVIYVLVFLLGK